MDSSKLATVKIEPGTEDVFKKAAIDSSKLAIVKIEPGTEVISKKPINENGNCNVPSGADIDKSDSNELKLIDLSKNFSPNSNLAKENCEEVHLLEKLQTRTQALLKWRWDQVIDVPSDDDETMDDLSETPASFPLGTIFISSDEDSSSNNLSDSSPSPQPRRKIPRVSVCNLHRPRKLRFSSDEDQ